jgi:hypothetical protein
LLQTHSTLPANPYINHPNLCYDLTDWRVIKNHTLNWKKSLAIYELYQELISKKECYFNIFRLIVPNKNKFITGDLKIAYGYVRVLQDHILMARHCFIVNQDGEAIDPTLFTNKYLTENEETEYVSFKIFNTLDDYMNELEQNGNVPDLINSLMNEDLSIAGKWAEENGWFLIR